MGKPQGAYCAQKTVGFKMLGLTQTVAVVTQINSAKETFAFRVNGDMHVAWCKGNRFFYSPETQEATLDEAHITPCLSQLKQRYTPDSKGLLSYVSAVLPT